MKKQQLLRLKVLTATEEMIRIAKQDIPVPKLRPYCKNEVDYVYKYGLYLLAAVEQGILKVALFQPNTLTLGGTKPAYCLFIDKAADDFIGYNYILKNWTAAMLERLPWTHRIWQSQIFCDKSSENCIQEYLNEDSEGYDAVALFQKAARRRQLLARHKVITDRWDLVMDQVPKEPSDFKKWLRKTGLTKHFIFYEYSRKGVKKGYCTWCEQEVPVKDPRHNKEARCSRCHHKIQYKAAKKAKKVITDEDTAYLVQNCGDGFVVREFIISMFIRTSDYRNPLFFQQERRRFVYNSSLHGTEYYYGLDRTTERNRWQEGELKKSWGIGYLYYVHSVRGSVYKKNFRSLKTGVLGRTGLLEYARQVPFLDPRDYMEHLIERPWMEQIVKAGLLRLTQEILQKGSSLSIPYEPAKDLGKALFIDKFRLQRLRENGGGSLYLSWLRFEKGLNTVISDEVISWMEAKGIPAEDILFVSGYMSAVQIKNYLERQAKESGETPKDLLGIWEDYLIMAKRTGADISDPIVYRARNLVERHNELIKVVGNKDIVKQAEETEKKYPVLPEIFQDLKRYEYSGKEYKIIAPKRAEDILIDSQKLNHCINSNERYFERMAEKESYILFLRKAAKDQEPYYTLEVEPNGTIRQKRTLYNRQTADIAQAEKFLAQWQKQLQKKLRKEDFELAKISCEKREQEMEELREKKVRVHGNFNGKLLADLLQEDLMEIPEDEKAA